MVAIEFVLNCTHHWKKFNITAQAYDPLSLLRNIFHFSVGKIGLSDDPVRSLNITDLLIWRFSIWAIDLRVE